MKTIKYIALIIASFFMLQSVSAQTAEQMTDAIAHGSTLDVIKMAANNQTLETMALDALCTNCNPDKLDYETVAGLVKTFPANSGIKQLLKRVQVRREQDIRAALNKLCLEQIVEYSRRYPARKAVVDDYVNSTIKKNLRSLSFLELNYLQTAMPDFDNNMIADEMATRAAEKKELVANNASNYLLGEKLTAKQIKYVMEKTIWSYFTEGHKLLTHSYSLIPYAPDDSVAAARQYQDLTYACIPTQMLQNALQSEVDKYCGQVNKARMEYGAVADIDSLTQMEFIVPEMNLADLATLEYKSRGSYVDDVYMFVYKAFKEYANDVISRFDEILFSNEAQYEECIKK